MWSKAKRALKSHWSDAVRDRVDIHMTTYPTSAQCGRVWITIDSVQVLEARDCDRCAAHLAARREGRESTPECDDHLGVADVLRAISGYCSASFDSSLASDDPLTQVFVALDRRLGKRRLREIDLSRINPMAAPFYEFRRELEGLETGRLDV